MTAFSSSEQDRCDLCGEFPWGDEECAICGAWLSEHDFEFDHAPVQGDGRSPHPTCFSAYWLALPYVPVRQNEAEEET